MKIPKTGNPGYARHFGAKEETGDRVFDFRGEDG